MSKRSSDEKRDRDSEVDDAKTIEDKAVRDSEKDAELDPEKGLKAGTDVDSVPNAPGEKLSKKYDTEAWMTLVGAWLIVFVGFGYMNAFGVYQDFYTREFLSNKTSSQISWIGSIQVFLLMGAGLFTGRLFDRGYFYHLIWAGSSLTVFSLFMLSLTKQGQYYQVFLAHGVGLGIGSGLSFIPALAVLAQHFPDLHERAKMMMIVASGSSVGGLVHPIMLNHLFNDKLGFHNGVRVSAGMNTALLLLALLLLRAKYDHGRGRAPDLIPIHVALEKFAKDYVYVLFVIGAMMVVCGLYCPLFYIQLDAVKRGLDSNFSFYTLSILNAASIFGRVVPGLYTREVGITNLLLFVGAACGVLNLAMVAVKTVAGFTIFAILYGFFSGAYVSIMTPMMALLADHPSEIGVRIGIAFTIIGVGPLFGTPVDGALLSSNFTWWKPMVFSGIMCLAGTVIFFAGRIAFGRRKNAGWIL
ncbi:MFS general substrate transporter [Schizopora paradoxa]|uniref:MFS general substrate transporter n=1 Tax=Schizopora paradoxa TaxID=27342 RepID=A0A0H2SMG7_9AGAM|nr:MFS general substrate transporter [Schizopora paradoxa]